MLGVDGLSGVWSLREVADARRKGWLGPYSGVALSLSPTALYMMDEFSGTQMVDLSPNANHGTYLNSALPSSPALVFEGDKSLLPTGTQYATAPGAVASATSGFSIVMWVQWSHSTNLVICERNQNAGYSIQSHTDGRIKVTSTSGSPFLYLESSGAINDGLPHCVVFVFGATAAASSVFVDGADVTVRGGNASPSYGSTTVWDIGSRAGTLAFAGRMDGVVFVPSLLTIEDAQALNAAGRALL